MFRSVCVFTAFIVLAPAAQAFDDSMGNSVLSSVALNASVAPSSMLPPLPEQALSTGNNTISNDAFSRAVGIISVAQNTGANSNTQIGNAVYIGQLTIGLPAQ